jgi:3-isopropylmalate/(R)-2-methylmalate dehydratase small subunit
MQPLERIRAVAVPMPESDINTDQIVPGRFMHKPREDYGRYCFHDLRFDPQGKPRPAFVLNRPAYAGARILVAGPNFGCGSSREHAVFTLNDYGFRVVLAPSFGDIFFNNCFQNGVLPAVLPAEFAAALQAQLRATPGAEVEVDLAGQAVVAPDGTRCSFPIDTFRKERLLQGHDELDLTLSLRPYIDAFEARQRPLLPSTDTPRHP